MAASTDPLDGFTTAARRALSSAPEEMERWGHSWIGPEHLLMALLRDQDSVAGVLLGQLRATDEIRRRLESVLGGMGPRELPQSPPKPPVKRVIAIAQEEARSAAATAAGTGHLLLAFLVDGEGEVADILLDARVEVATVRERLATLSAPGEEED